MSKIIEKIKSKLDEKAPQIITKPQGGDIERKINITLVGKTNSVETLYKAITKMVEKKRSSKDFRLAKVK